MTRQRMGVDGERDYSRPTVAPRRGKAHADGSAPRHVRTPSPWQALFDDLRDYSGVTWCRPTFELTNDERRTTNDERSIDWSLVACPERSRRLGRWSLVVALLLSACGNTYGSAQPGAATAVGEASAIPAATIVRTPLPTPGPNEFTNPVIDQDFPDPDLLKVGDTYYAYATNSGDKNIQVAKSADLVTWQMLDDALPQRPKWASETFGLIWAPEVTTWDGGKTFTMYFVARDIASSRQCIGAATNDKPDGPFKAAGDKPLICQVDLGGSIDPSSFVDEDGTRYVLWKNDGNCCGKVTNLFIQKVSPDGLALEGEPTKLIRNDQSWEGGLVEAPTLWKHGGKYYLFYSANDYAGVKYAIGYAMADKITGPYTKPSKKPLLASDLQHGAAIGPGGQDVVLDKNGKTWLVFHSWDPTATYRRMMLNELVWEGDTPVVKGPDRGPQPKP
jgi:arabinan endo-1,5-alpha-L-arabinosidase